MVVDIGYWLLEQIRNYLHCDSMFGIQLIKYLHVADAILNTHVI